LHILGQHAGDREVCVISADIVYVKMIVETFTAIYGWKKIVTG
jgi:hypothetical protein